MRPRAALAAAFAVLTVAAFGVAPPPAARAADAGDREWNQTRGSSERSGATLLRPVASDPQIAWRRKLAGPLAGEPVSWGGVVFVPSRNGDFVELRGIDARTGNELFQRRLDKGTWADLAVWQGIVIVGEEGQLRGFPFKDGKLGMPWRKKGGFRGGQCVAGGVCVARDGGQMKMYDPRTGRELAKADWLLKGDPLDENDAFSMLAVRATGGGLEVAGAHRSRKDKLLRITTLPLVDPGGRKPSFGALAVKDVLPIVDAPDADALHATLFGWCATDEKGDSGSWTLTARAKGTGWIGTLAIDPFEPAKRLNSDIATQPAADGGCVYGFSREGTLLRITPDRRADPLTTRGSLPQGARPGPAAASKGVLCFGNWAFEIESGRTMWVLADLPEIASVTPVADSFVLLGTAEDELVCLAEPDALAAANDPASAAAGAEDAPPPPEPGDGVLLADGRKLLGDVDMNGDTIVVKAEGGDPLELTADEVAFGESSGRIVHRGEEPQILRAWETILDGVFVRALNEAYEGYRKERLLTECRRLIEDMRGYGAGHALVEGLQAGLAGQTENPNADMKLKRLGPIEADLRKRALDQVFAAVDWCAEREYGGAATALLSYAQREHAPEERIEELAAKLIPAGFPWRDAPQPGHLWLQWAQEIVPAGGEFLSSSDVLWKKASYPPWNKDTLGFRTRNVTLLSRSKDIKVIGMCLRVGEGTVRALEGLLGKGGANSRAALDVRLHANRKDYLEEKTPIGSALPWSAGYFSPAEGVSRFYVPGDEGNVEPLGRGLSKVLAHELTHHWLEMRWLPGGGRSNPATSGYWIVEGFARFIEDQSVEMGRRAGRLDDPTVSSLDATSQVAKQDKIMQVPDLVAMTQIDFSKIPEKQVAVVFLRNTVGNRVLDVRALFYEQAGSLVFFMMNRCGEEGRAALERYMRGYYSGRAAKDPSKELGFADSAEFHAKFREFLMSLLK